MLGARLITGRMTRVILPRTAKKIPKSGRYYKFARATQPYRAPRERSYSGTSSAGFLSKNPDGTSLNPAVATGIIGHSSGRG